MDFGFHGLISFSAKISGSIFESLKYVNSVINIMHVRICLSSINEQLPSLTYKFMIYYVMYCKKYVDKETVFLRLHQSVFFCLGYQPFIL